MAGEMINICTKVILRQVDLVTKEYEISRHQTFTNRKEYLLIFERACNESLKKGIKRG